MDSLRARRSLQAFVCSGRGSPLNGLTSHNELLKSFASGKTALRAGAFNDIQHTTRGIGHSGVLTVDEVDGLTESILGPGKVEDHKGYKTVRQEHGDVESSLIPISSPSGFGSGAGSNARE